MRKFESLDIARGLAALAVVFFHRGVFPGTPHPLDWIIRYGEVGAQIFFVISGYLIYQSAERQITFGFKGSVTFLCNRFRRIYPPFWASLIIAFLVAIFLQGESFSVADILGSATLTYSLLDLKAPQVVYWTLIHEQQFYIIMAILILPHVQKYRYLLIALSSLFPIIFYSKIMSNWYVNGTIVSHWLEFEMGIIACIIINYTEKRKIFLPIFLGLVIIGLLGNYRSQAAAIFSCLIFGLKKIDMAISSKNFFDPFRALGTISYSLYLVHIPVFVIFSYLIVNVIPSDLLSYYVASIVTALIFSIVFFWVFEKPFLYSRYKNVAAVA